MAQINSNLDVTLQARGPSPLAPGGEAVIGAMANGMWRPGVMTDTPDSLRRPTRRSQDNTTAKDLSVIDRVTSDPVPFDVPFAALPSDVIRRRSQVTSSHETSLERLSPPASDLDKTLTPGNTSPELPPPGRPLSTDAKPFSPTRGVDGGGPPQRAPPTTSVLSADAKEFVPRRRPQPQAVEYVRPEHKHPSHGGAVSRSRHGGHDSRGGYGGRGGYRGHDSRGGYGGRDSRDSRGGYVSPFDVEVTSEEAAMHHLIEVMAHLTLNPGSFDKMVPPLVSAFGSWLEDEETVRAVVGALFEQSITDANFRFNGARLCHQLNNAFEAKFRSHLLNTCRREHERLSNALDSDAGRAYGYLLFVADLYVTLEVVRGSGQRIDILGRALVDAVGSMLEKPEHDNVKCVCQALKLAGYHLDATMKPDVDAILVRLREIQRNDCAEPRVQALVLNLVNLRQDNWGISRQAAQAAVVMQPPATPPATPSAAVQTQYFGPVFYGPDGHVLSAEERQFLQDNSSPSLDEADSLREDVCWDPDEEMDDEIHAAFEQFLLYGKKKTTN